MSVTTQMEAWRESNDDCLRQKALEDRKWMAKKMSSLKRDLLTELESQMTDLQTEWRMNNNVLRDKVDEMLQTDIPDRKGILDILRDFDQTWDEKILIIKGTTEGIEALKQNGDGGDVKSERSEGGRRVEGGETMKVSCGCGRQGSGGWKKRNRWQKIRMEEEMFLRRAVERQNIQAQEERRERVNLQRQRQREDKKREEETKKREREQLENEQRLMEEEKRITGMREKVLQAQERVIDNKREECDRKINKVNKIVMETRAQVEEAKKRERDLLRKAKEIADKREECDRTVDQVNRKVLELRAQAKTAKKRTKSTSKNEPGGVRRQWEEKRSRIELDSKKRQEEKERLLKESEAKVKQREHEEKLLKESEAKQREEEQRLANWHEEEEHRLSVEARRKEEENRKKVFEAKLQKAKEEGERLVQQCEQEKAKRLAFKEEIRKRKEDKQKKDLETRKAREREEKKRSEYQQKEDMRKKADEVRRKKKEEEHFKKTCEAERLREEERKLPAQQQNTMVAPRKKTKEEEEKANRERREVEEALKHPNRAELERLLKREQAKIVVEKRRLAGVGGVESSTVMKKPNGCTIFDKDPELLLSSEEETDGEFDRQGEEEQSQIEMGGKKMEEKHESEEDKWLKEDIVQPRKPKVNKFKTFFQKFIPGF